MTTRREDDLLAAEYVMGVLPHAERLVFANRLEREEALRRRVEAWETRLAPLRPDSEDVTPPAALRSAILGAVAPAQPRPTWWNSLALWRGATAAALAALALITILLVRTPPANPVLVADIVSTDSSVRVIAYYDQATGLLHVDRRAGERASGRDMEMWLIAGSGPPQSLGLMPAIATGSMTIPAAFRSGLETATLAISDEPAGGSPTGQPTGPVVAQGTLHIL